MQNRIRGCAPPPRTVRMNVLRVTTTEATQFIVCCRVPWGQMIHWYGRRSHECKSDRALCQGCRDNWPMKFKAYLHVMGAGLGSQAFLEITATAFHLIEEQLGDRADWRGSILKIRRTKGGAKGRYICEVLERVIPDSELPQEQDPLPTLRYLWGVGKAPSQAA